MRYITAQSFYKHVIGAAQTQVDDETRVVSVITKVCHTCKLYQRRGLSAPKWDDPRHSYIVIDEQGLSAHINPEMITNPGFVPGIILQLKYVPVGRMYKSFVYLDDHLYMSATGGFYYYGGPTYSFCSMEGRIISEFTGESIKIMPVNLDDILDIVDVINKRKYFNKIINGMGK
jgi:hypothetical protein